MRGGKAVAVIACDAGTAFSTTIVEPAEADSVAAVNISVSTDGKDFDSVGTSECSVDSKPEFCLGEH